MGSRVGSPNNQSDSYHPCILADAVLRLDNHRELTKTNLPEPVFQERDDAFGESLSSKTKHRPDQSSREAVSRNTKTSEFHPDLCPARTVLANRSNRHCIRVCPAAGCYRRMPRRW